MSENTAAVTERDEKVLAFVQALAAQYPEVQRVMLFGSRARGDHRPTSDYDLLVTADRLSHPRWLALRRAADEHAPTLCQLDLVNGETLAADFRGRAEDEGVVVYERS